MKNDWLWLGAGVGGAAALGVAAYLLTRPTEPVEPQSVTLTVQEPDGTPIPRLASATTLLSLLMDGEPTSTDDNAEIHADLLPGGHTLDLVIVDKATIGTIFNVVRGEATLSVKLPLVPGVWMSFDGPSTVPYTTDPFADITARSWAYLPQGISEVHLWIDPPAREPIISPESGQRVWPGWSGDIKWGMRVVDLGVGQHIFRTDVFDTAGNVYMDAETATIL